WCRPVMEDDCPDDHPGCGSCTPYQQEGETCGGFTPYWAQNKCDPSLTCGDFPAGIADPPGTCLADEEPVLCTGADGQEYEPGQSFPGTGDNWCNTCTCQDSGEVVCTMIGCVNDFCEDDSECQDTHWCRPVMEDDCPIDYPDCSTCVPYQQEGESCGGFTPIWGQMKCDPSLTCGNFNPMIPDLPGECLVPIPQSCEPGTLGVAEDGCNDCLCMEDGTWYCNETACTSECFAGEQKMAADGCNTCNCSVNADGVGIWNCTKKGCFGCLPGETMTAPDGCNTCMCIPEDGFNDDEPIDDGPDDDFGEFDEKGEPEEEDPAMSPCWNCLMTGGTWQPEAEACTTNCDIQDISCYVDSCPEEEPMDDQWICTELLECVDVVPAGCTSDFDCADGFCKTPYGQCGGAGECKPYAQVCPDVWTPVCGCDDNTYGNDCDADISGVSVAYDGPCDDAGGGPDGDVCPAAVPFDGMCAQMIAWAFKPESATCCPYPNPCVVPAGLEGPFGSEEECLAGGPDGGDGGGFDDGGGGDFDGDFGDGGGFEPN
ncbi:MAG: hypothetical protein VYE15_07570, partial [Myxococcota bacterium]|nr:hypothetical protein [Myxococcota bacterium]